MVHQNKGIVREYVFKHPDTNRYQVFEGRYSEAWSFQQNHYHWRMFIPVDLKAVGSLGEDRKELPLEYLFKPPAEEGYKNFSGTFDEANRFAKENQYLTWNTFVEAEIRPPYKPPRPAQGGK
jgi:hypothetical protein